MVLPQLLHYALCILYLKIFYSNIRLSHHIGQNMAAFSISKMRTA